MSKMDSKLLDEKIKEMVDEIKAAIDVLSNRSRNSALVGRPNDTTNFIYLALMLHTAYLNFENYSSLSPYMRNTIVFECREDFIPNWLLSTIMNVCIVSEKIGERRSCEALFETQMIENTLHLIMLLQHLEASRSPYTAIYLDEIDGERSEPFANMDHLYTEQICCSIRGTTLLCVDLDYELKEPIANALPFKPGKLYRARNCEELEDAICDRAHTITKNLARDNGIYYA